MEMNRKRKQALSLGIVGNVIHDWRLADRCLWAGNWVVHDIVTAGESFGWVLMMAMGMLHLQRRETKR